MYNAPPAGTAAAGLGGTLLTTPWLGIDAVWIGLAVFTLISAVLAAKRALPKRER